MTPLCLTMIHDPFKQTLLDRMMCPRAAKCLIVVVLQWCFESSHAYVGFGGP